MAFSPKKLSAYVLLKETKLARDGRLDQVQQLCCPGHVACIGHGHERAKLFEVHGQAFAMKNRDSSISNFYLVNTAIRFYDFSIATSLPTLTGLQ